MTRISQLTRIGAVALLLATTLAFAPADASAQPRGGHRGGGGGGGRGRATVVVASPFYYGYGFYDPFWGPMGSPFGWYGPHFNSNTYDANLSSARLQVKPRSAEVYVDGYLAGTVDDFDGALQRLSLPAGEHTLTLYLDGYQTMTQKVLFRPRATLNFKYDLAKLGAGESSGPRPAPADVEPGAAQVRPLPPAPPEAQRRASRARGNGFGTLAVRVQPGDALVIIDGQEWDADGPLTIELPEGQHDVEVRQDGFAPFRRSVRVRAGDVTTINVSLSR